MSRAATFRAAHGIGQIIDRSAQRVKPCDARAVRCRQQLCRRGKTARVAGHNLFGGH